MARVGNLILLFAVLILTASALPGSNNGKYIHMRWPYKHAHDNRELGKYVHVHIPYDGGYGPYSGSLIPYVHDASGLDGFEKYVHDADQYPFNADQYEIPRPKVSLEYGFPQHKDRVINIVQEESVIKTGPQNAL